MDGPILVEIPPINRNLSYWHVGIGVSYNISSLYKSNKSLVKSREATRMAVEKYDAARENVSLDVRAAYIRYLEAYEELKTREECSRDRSLDSGSKGCNGNGCGRFHPLLQAAGAGRGDTSAI